MIKEKVKRFREEYGGLIGCIICFFLFSGSIYVFMASKPIWIKLSFITAFILYTIIGCKRIMKSVDKELKQEETKRKNAEILHSRWQDDNFRKKKIPCSKKAKDT